MTKLEKKLISYANHKIDNECEWGEIKEVIKELLEFGFTKEELIEMQFDEIDILDVLYEIDESEEGGDK